jgi:hypothetical protein
VCNGALVGETFPKTSFTFVPRLKITKELVFQKKGIMFVFVIIEVRKHIVHCSHLIPHVQGIEYLLDPSCVTQLEKLNDYFI